MMKLLLAATVILPVWAWSPSLIDDARLDGALVSLLVFAALLWKPAKVAPGTMLFLAAVTLAIFPLFAIGVPIVGGLTDRAPLLAAWGLLAAAIARPKALEQAWTPILIAVFAAAGYGLLQLWGIDPLNFSPPSPGPPVAPFSGTNHAAEIIAPALIAALALGWSGKRFLLLLPASFMLGYWDVLAAMISLPVGVLALWVQNRAKPHRQMLPAVVVLMVMAMGNLSLDRELPATSSSEVSVNQAEHGPGTGLPTSIKIRLLTNKNGIQHALSLPFGIGLGRYENDHPGWMPPELLEIASHNFTDPATPRAKDPHNEALLMLLEAGWLGLALACAALWLLWKRPERAHWTSAPLLVLAVHALVRSPFTDNGSALALAALLFAASTRHDEKPGIKNWRAAIATHDWRLLPALTMVSIAACLAVPQLLGELNIAAALKDGQRDQGKLIAAAAPLQRALDWRPWDAVGWGLEASRLSHAGAEIADIRAALVNALRHDPANLFAHTALIKLEMLAVETTGSGFEALALASLTSCENLAPRHPAVREARTLWLEHQARTQRAVANQLLEEQAAAAAPRFFAAHCFEALALARRGQFEDSRKALQAAAIYAAEHRPLFSRVARQADLSVDKVRGLLIKVAPDWEIYLGQ